MDFRFAEYGRKTASGTISRKKQFVAKRACVRPRKFPKEIAERKGCGDRFAPIKEVWGEGCTDTS